MAKGPIYNGPCVVEITGDAEIKHVPSGEGCGISVEQLKNGYLIVVDDCRVFRRHAGIQLVLASSSLVTFGWEFYKIREIKQPNGKVIWRREIEPQP